MVSKPKTLLQISEHTAATASVFLSIQFYISLHLPLALQRFMSMLTFIVHENFHNPHSI